MWHTITKKQTWNIDLLLNNRQGIYFWIFSSKILLRLNFCMTWDFYNLLGYHLISLGLEAQMLKIWLFGFSCFVPHLTFITVFLLMIVSPISFCSISSVYRYPARPYSISLAQLLLSITPCAMSSILSNTINHHVHYEIT